MLALAIALLSCSDRDAQIGCSPTLTCSLHGERFEPPESADAGPRKCEPRRRRCRAEYVTAGAHHACAIARAGELLCWGDDTQGQRGVERAADGGMDGVDGMVGMTARDAGNERDAGLTPALLAVERAAAGGAHTCALREDGTLLCWGRNAEGQVDGVPSEPVRTPRELELPKLSDVCAGAAHSCALGAEGVLCWGDARYGQVGRELREGSLAPELVTGTRDAVEVACGARHSCARFANGSVACWGELVGADGTLHLAVEPEPVPGLPDAVQISAGAGHSCALRSGGRPVCWGRNESGQLGDGTRTARSRPVAVQEIEQSLHVSAGGLDEGGELIGHSCAQTKAFNVRCWGRNREGQLGDGSADDRSRAVLVRDRPDDQSDSEFLDETVSISAGGRFSCSLDQDGPVYCWGDNGKGELGLPRGEEAVFGRPSGVRRFTFSD